MALFVRNGGSRHTGQAAPPQRNIQLVIGCFGFIGLILLTDICGLHFSFWSDKVLHWCNNCNPFLLSMSLAMFNIARNIHFKNRLINYISSLSLLIYIIHENIILRTYFRPAMWNYVYEKFGYSHVIGWGFIIAFIIFIFGVLGSVIYTVTLKKLIGKESDILYSVFRKYYLIFENKALNYKV